jgi:hypothetical protein
MQKLVRILVMLILRICLIILLVIIGSYFVLPEKHLKDFRIVHAVAQQLSARGLYVPMIQQLSPLTINRYDCRPQNDFRRFDGKANSSTSTPNSREWSIITEVASQDPEAQLGVDKQLIDTRLQAIFQHIQRLAPGIQPVQVGFRMKLYPDERTLWQYLLAERSRLIDIGGAYDSMTNSIVVNAQTPPKNLIRIIQHEGTHAMIYHLWGETPTWFNEGMASYYENLAETASGLKVKLDKNYLTLLNTLAKQDRLLRLVDYLNPAVDYWHSPQLEKEQLTVLYALSWSLIHFMTTNAPDLLLNYTQILSRNTCALPNDIVFIDQHFSGGIAEFEQQWLKWLKTASH